MKRIVALLLAVVLFALTGTAFAEGITEKDYEVVTLPASSGRVYENIALLNPSSLGGQQGDSVDEGQLEGKVISVADALDAALTMLQEKLRVSIDGEMYIKCNFYLAHEAVEDGYCRQVLVYMDSTGETYFDILMDMDGHVRQCELHCA